MPTDYEKLYRGSRHVLGAPTREFVRFFETAGDVRLRVLDIGCGQGRDALFIARLGHSVVGVDHAPSGIRDLLADAAAENLDIEGHAADIRFFEPAGLYDVLLIDRTLHMLGEPERFSTFARLLDYVAIGGFVLLADESSNMPEFARALETDRRDWNVFLRRSGYLFASHQE